MGKKKVQSNTEVYSSFASIYINPVMYSYLIKVCLGGVRLWKQLCLGRVTIDLIFARVA